ncbi:MAG: TlpA disulfide reductase family protein [Saprospiraceae bacterium]
MIVFMSLSSCKRNVSIFSNETTIIQGKITSLPSSKITFIGGGSQTFYASESGDFLFKSNISRSGIYRLIIEEKEVLFFVKPGDSISLVSDFRTLQKNAIFKGSHSLENSFLSEMFSHKGEIFVDDYLSQFSLPYDSFSIIADQRDDFLTQNVQEFQKKNGTFAESFNALIMKDIAFENAKFRLSYPINKKVMFKDSILLPETYESFLQNLDIDNPENFLVPSFEEFILLYVDYLNYIKNEAEIPSLMTKWHKIDETFTNERIRNFLFHNVFLEAADLDFDAFQNIAFVHEDFQKDTSFLRQEKRLIDALEHLMEGKVAPQIIARDINSNEVNITSFNGKYKYIDVWATWCEPCIKEMPNLDELQSRYKELPIAFLSISIDDNEKVWKSFIKKKGVKGTHLRVDGGWNSDLATKFNIESIPRFIFLDKENNIINANAPRPSDVRLHQIFEKYLY